MSQKTIIKKTNYATEKNIFENNWNSINMQKNDKIITAVGKPSYFCVGIIDIMDSTKTVARLQQNKVAQYYEIFLNIMAKTINSNHGKVLKIMGDSLLFYFPDTCHSEDKSSFLNAIECGFSMMDIHEKLTYILKKYTLPKIDFRISFDYGNVTIMRTENGLMDLVGPTINTCAKINELAMANSMIIGGDLFEKIKHFNEYKFRNSKSLSIGLKQSYPSFTLCRKI